MVKILKLLGYALFFILALIYFMPKVSVYYYAEKVLAKQKIVLSDEEIVDNSFSLELNHAILSYDSIESAQIQQLDIKIFLLYNSISLKNIELSHVASSLMPLHIDSLDVTYSIFNPLHLVARASGEFGEASAEVSILDRNVSVVLTPSELMSKSYKSTLHTLNVNEAGEYEYDKTF